MADGQDWYDFGVIDAATGQPILVPRIRASDIGYQHHRELDDNHTDPVEGQLIESLVVTPDKLQAMGLSSESLPQAWWVGFQLENEAVFAKVLSGEYTMFSIAGTASLIPVE